MENKEEKTIKSLNDFVDWVRNVNSPQTGREYFFRGHSKLSYELKPAVYRSDQQGKTFRECERSMYYEMLNRLPHEFDRNDIFGNLAKMQHFGIPTRLLDVTQNSLVALYFACKGSAAEDGRVFGFSVDTSAVSFPEDLPSSCLYLPDYKKIRFYGGGSGNDFWLNFMEEIVERLKATAQDLSREPLDKSLATTVNSWLSTLKTFDGNWDESKYNAFANLLMRLFGEASKFPEVWAAKLIGHDVMLFLERQFELSSRWPALAGLWTEITRPIFVKSPINNARIASQQGGFIVFPPHPHAIREHLYVQGVDTLIYPIKVDGEMKPRIKAELEFLGISEHVLFPEIDRVAKYVCGKYSV